MHYAEYLRQRNDVRDRRARQASGCPSSVTRPPQASRQPAKLWTFKEVAAHHRWVNYVAIKEWYCGNEPDVRTSGRQDAAADDVVQKNQTMRLPNIHRCMAWMSATNYAFSHYLIIDSRVKIYIYIYIYIIYIYIYIH